MKKLFAYSFLVITVICMFGAPSSALAITRTHYDDDRLEWGDNMVVFSQAEADDTDTRLTGLADTVTANDGWRRIPDGIYRDMDGVTSYGGDGRGNYIKKFTGANGATVYALYEPRGKSDVANNTDRANNDILKEVVVREPNGTYTQYEFDDDRCNTVSGRGACFDLVEQLHPGLGSKFAYDIDRLGNQSILEQSQGNLDDDIRKYQDRLNDLNNKDTLTPEEQAEKERLEQLLARDRATKAEQDAKRDTVKKLAEVKIVAYSLSNCNPINGFDMLGCLIGLMQLVADLVSYLLALAAVLFETVLKYTVVYFSTFVSGTGAFKQSVEVVWQLIKNLANLIFIGILLYIAVKTIIDGDGFQEKSRLKTVIIMAFLINFSMFFTKILIDLSNTATVEIYNTITSFPSVQAANNLNVVTGGKSGIFGVSDTPLADAFLAGMKITAIYGSEADKGVILLRVVVSIFVIIVAACVFVAAGAMFLIRFFMIIFLMMTSPIGYVGSLLPITQGMSAYWWSNFKKNLVFAPAFMIMAYIALQLISFSASSSIGQGVDIVSTLIMYAISIFALVSCLIVASMAGGNAATASMGAGWARKAIGGGTFGLAGRGGRLFLGGTSQAVSDRLKDAASKRGVLGSLARGTKALADKGAKSTYDFRNTGAGKNLKLGDGIKSYADVSKDRDKFNAELNKKDLEATKNKFQLSDKEQVEKAKTDNIAKTYEANAKAQKSYDDNNKTIDKTKAELAEIEKDIRVEGAKIEAEVQEQQKVEREAIENQLKAFAERFEATTDKSTKDDLKVKMDKQNARLSELDAQKAAMVAKRINESTAGKQQRKAELEERTKDLEKKTVGLNNALSNTVANLNTAKKQLADLGIDTSKENIEKLVKRNKELGDKEKKQSNDYLKVLEARSSGVMGAFNGRNEAYQKEFLKKLRDKMKDKESKEFEKMLKETMKKRAADDEGGEPKEPKGEDQKPKVE